MNSYQPFGQPTQTNQTAYIQKQNRVLRNTYALLALSMIPTIVGAVLALQLGLFQALHGGLFAIVFLLGSLGLMFLVEKNKNNSKGVGFLLLFTFFMGMMLARTLGFVLMLHHGAQLIALACGGTALIFGLMALISTTTKRDFTYLQKTLFIGAIVILVLGIGNIFLQLPALSLAISVMAMVVFSVFMLVDLQRIVNGGETNYISATLALYLDIYNVFVSLLNILGVMNSRD